MNGDYHIKLPARRASSPEGKIEKEPMNQCQCINKLYRARYEDIDMFTVRDMLSGKVFIMCPRCFDKIKRLTNFQVVAYPRDSMKAR